jgi:hypothetical protein
VSASWEQPSKRRRAAKVAAAELEREDWATRLLAIVLAVPVFELSLYLGLATLVVSPRMAAFIFINLPWGFHVAYVALAISVAARYGMSGSLVCSVTCSARTSKTTATRG